MTDSQWLEPVNSLLFNREFLRELERLDALRTAVVTTAGYEHLSELLTAASGSPD